MGTISIAPPPNTVPTPDLEMDIEQVTEVMSDQGWGEEETSLVDPARHVDIEEVEGNDSSSDSNDEECSTEEEMNDTSTREYGCSSVPTLSPETNNKTKKTASKEREV